MEYRNITVVGTSHIAKQSLDEVAREIESKKPSIIAIELDRKRLHVLFNRKDNKISIYAISKVGLKGYIFALIGAWAEKKLGEHVGVMPGSEMKSAAEIAKKKGIRLALIDQDIEVTLSRLSKSLSWKEKRNFIADIFKGVVLRKKEVEFDLTTVPDKKLIKKLLGQVKKRYPNIYRVLVAERNQVMADNLIKLMKTNEGRILAFVGAGHEEEIITLVKERINKIDISYTVNVGEHRVSV